MAATIGLTTSISGKLSLTQDLRQVIELLQMPSSELIAKVQELVAANPLLEVKWRNGAREMLRREPLRDARLIGIDGLAADEHVTLEHYLLAQLRLLDLPKEMFHTAVFIAGNLTDAGYLAAPLKQLAAQLKRSIDDAEAALDVIHDLEPAGVGARTLAECLSLQAKRDPFAPMLVFAIAEQELERVARGQLGAITERLGATMDEVTGAVAYLKHLNPRPGLAFGQGGEKAIVPEIVIAKGISGYEAQLADTGIPKIQLMAGYEQWLAQTKNDPQRHRIREQLRAARALLYGLKQRETTLLTVANAIAAEQTEMFECGMKKMKPLTLRLISERTGYHESTVSRAAQGKYARTPIGTVALQFFFTSSIRTHEGNTVSSRYAKQRIADVVAKENKREPLSDVQIAKALENEGIRLSRRTIAKYREELRIPAYTFRAERTAEAHYSGKGDR